MQTLFRFQQTYHSMNDTDLNEQSPFHGRLENFNGNGIK